jgi:hypothetical protein
MKGVPMAPLVPGVATSRFSSPSFPPPLAPSAAVDESGGRRTGAEGFRNARRLRRAAAVVGKGRSWRLCALALPWMRGRKVAAAAVPVVVDGGWEQELGFRLVRGSLMIIYHQHAI